LKKIYLNNNYEVYQIDIVPFFGCLSLLIVIQTILTLLFIKGSFWVILLQIACGLLWIIISFYISKKDLFSDKVLGEILSITNGNNLQKFENYRNAIRSKLKSSPIFLSQAHLTLLDELDMVFRTYESCPPIVYNARFPSLSETNNLFKENLKNKNSTFEKFGLKAESFLYIFKINAIFYSTYYNSEVNSKILKYEGINVPIQLRLHYDVNTKPVFLVDDVFYKKFVAFRSNFMSKLTSVLPSDFKIKGAGIEDLKDELIIFDYCEDIYKLFNEIRDIGSPTVYKALSDLLCLQLLSNSVSLLRSIRKRKLGQKKNSLSEQQVNQLILFKEEFSIQQLNPVLEFYRKQILDLELNVEEILDFSLQFAKEFPFMVTALINNHWMYCLENNMSRTFLLSFSKLSQFYHEKMTLNHPNGTFEYDYSLEKGNFELLYNFENRSLNKDIINRFHTLALSKSESEHDLHQYQSIIFRFSKIVDDVQLVEWYKENSSLSQEEMNYIEDNLLNNLYHGNKINMESNLIYYCFPTAISKEDIGKFVF
jgi:hypothetical protein